MFVIADDITGAAEIAGIAKALGFVTHLLVYSKLKSIALKEVDDTSVTVIATDTRSMSEVDAVKTIKDIAQQYNFTDSRCVVFKKVDSALRGHIVAEINSLLEYSHYNRVLFVPCNPSKGRIIRNGIYYINEIPLSETDFSFDPEFPAYSSSMKERFPELICNDAPCKGDIQNLIESASEDTLLVGAADLFTSFLEKKSPMSNAERLTSNVECLTSTSRIIIVQGSTQSQNLSETKYFKDNSICVCPMPDDVFDGEERTDWACKDGNICLTIPQKRSNPEWCKYIMAKTVKEVFAQMYQNCQLIIEGGATAYAILQELGLTDFEVVEQIAPGVVKLKALPDESRRTSIYVTLKPGSYIWDLNSIAL